MGSPVTVMVRVSPSASVGVVSPNPVSSLASSTVIALLLTTGGWLISTVIVPSPDNGPPIPCSNTR